MTREELIRALRRLAPETGSLCCLGCGYEHNCSTHGCAVIREAVEALKEPPNGPLTLEQLREMDGEPVWNDTMKKWVLVDLTWELGERTADAGGKWRDLDDRYYRRKPEEGERL